MSIKDECGAATILALLGVLLMTAIGSALTLTSSVESMIAANYRQSSEAQYAADAVLELAIVDLFSIRDWDRALAGSARSSFAEGSPAGPRTLADGSTLNLSEVLNLANCLKPSECSDADMNASTSDRPWGVNNPRWQPYAYGNLADLLPTGSVQSRFYVLAMVGDDPSETDGNPRRDAPRGTSGSGVVSIRAEAFGPGGAHQVVEATIIQPGLTQPAPEEEGDQPMPLPRALSWRQVR